jgi:beta-lactam-binding protein with PASTA domain
VVIIAGLGTWYFTKGSDKKAVPAVVGLRIDAAVERLQADGFKLQTQRASSARAPGIVFGQNPAQGTDEAKGSGQAARLARSEPQGAAERRR